MFLAPGSSWRVTEEGAPGEDTDEDMINYDATEGLTGEVADYAEQLGLRRKCGIEAKSVPLAAVGWRLWSDQRGHGRRYD